MKMEKYLKEQTRPLRRAAFSSGRLTVSAALLKLYSFALIGLSALSVQSCRTVKSTESSVALNQHQLHCDSSASVSIRKVTAVAVPADTAELTIAVDSFRHLPREAAFTASSGRARVIVRRVNDTIMVWATCDSLQRLCEEQQSRIESLRQNSIVKAFEGNRESRLTKPPDWVIIVMFALFAAMLAVIAVVMRRS